MRVAIVCCALLAYAGTALADGADTPTLAKDRTDELWLEGQSAVDVGNWELAWTAFKQAYALNPTLKIRYNLALAALYTERYLDSARLLRQVVRECEENNACPAKVKETAPPRLATAEQHVGRIKIETNVAGARVLVDQENVDQAVAGDVWHVTAGQHELVVEVGNDSQVRNVDVAAGALATLKFEFGQETERPGVQPPTPSPEPPLESQSASAKRSVTIGGAGLTAAAFGVATVFSLKARTAEAQADRLDRETGGTSHACYQPTSSACSDLRDAARRRDSSAAIAKVSWMATGVLGGATLVTYLLWPAPQGAAAQVTPELTSQYGGVIIQGAF